MSKNTGYERFMVPSIHDIPGVQAKAAFLNVNSSSVFREQDIDAQPLGDHEYYMPWGMDNAMPYNIMDLIESDETVSTCLMWNSQMCYGSGLQYNTPRRWPTMWTNGRWRIRCLPTSGAWHRI